MPRKPVELPTAVAKAFIKDMRAFFAAGGTGVKADGIAARQLHVLNALFGQAEAHRRERDVSADEGSGLASR
jgi:hypothetical protein